MRVKRGILPILVLLLAFCAYFASEMLLRQAAVARVNPETVKLTELVEHLPNTMRERVLYRAHLSTLREQVRVSQTEGELVSNLFILLHFSEDKSEKEQCRKKIFALYPQGMENAYPVYIQYLDNTLHPGTPVSLASIKATLPTLSAAGRYNVLAAVLNAFIQEKRSDDDRFEFLSCMLSFEPEFYDYESLYSELKRTARDRNDSLLPLIERRLEKISYLPSFSDHQIQREKDRAARQQRILIP